MCFSGNSQSENPQNLKQKMSRSLGTCGRVAVLQLSVGIVHGRRYRRHPVIRHHPSVIPVLVPAVHLPAAAVVHFVLDVVVGTVQIIVIVHHVVRSLPPLVVGPPAGVHEEVADGGGLEAQLPRDGNLHLLRGTLSLLNRAEVEDRGND